jgi:hypothetical protein
VSHNAAITLEGLHDFFVAAAGVAGALVGLLFVAISVAGDRLDASDAQIHRIRAQAALTTFLNSLVISLFALISTSSLGGAAIIAAFTGLASVASSLLSILRRSNRWNNLRDAAFLLALLAVLVTELVTGLEIRAHPPDSGGTQRIAVLVVLCFAIGVARSWELIGAPESTGVVHEIALLLRRADNQPHKSHDT